MGEGSIVWWRPPPLSAIQATADATIARGQAMDNKYNGTLCRDEIVHELARNAATCDGGEFTSDGVETISENCAR